jgi:hypothetical protein
VRARQQQLRRGCGCAASAVGAVDRACPPASAPNLMLTAPPITILGGGIVGSSIAYELSLAGARSLLEGTAPATAASGKAGGFLVSEWRGGKVTDRLFRTSFDMHAVLAEKLKLSSYRRFRAYKLGEGDEAAPSWLRGYAQQLSGEAAQVGRPSFYGRNTNLLMPCCASHCCVVRWIRRS